MLDGKVVIVTGAGAGNGLGILRQAIAAGARTIGFDRNPAGKAKVEAEGGRFVEVDVTDLDGFEAALQAVRRDEGRLDGLVNERASPSTSRFSRCRAPRWSRCGR